MIGFLLLSLATSSTGLALQPTAEVGLLTIFDAYIVWPTYREYGKQRASVSTGTAGARWRSR